METAFVFFPIAILLIAAILLSRFLVRKKVTRLMMVPSTEANRAAIRDNPTKEVRAKATPDFNIFTADDVLPEAVSYREVLMKNAFKQFSLTYVYDLLAAVGYWVIIGDDGFFIAIAYGMMCTIRFLVYKGQFKAHHKGFFGFLTSITKSYFQIQNPKFSFYLALLAIIAALLNALSSFSYDIIDTLRSLFAAFFHIALLVHLRIKLSKTPNLKLLVLRVFKIDDAAFFTFEGLLKYWEHFGSFFTIVDPSFLKSTVRQRSQTIPILAFTFLALIFTEVVLSDMKVDIKMINLFIILPMVALGSFFFVKYSLAQVDKRFIKSEAHLHSELEKLDKWPRNWNHTFKSLPTMCYDNTWKMAVAEYVHQSEVILMDLRGFSEERKGCEYEVNFLFDNAKVEKMVFLIRPDGLDLVKKLMLDSWEHLQQHSPNLDNNHPTITIYCSSRENKKDIQGIFDLLLYASN